MGTTGAGTAGELVEALGTTEAGAAEEVVEALGTTEAGAANEVVVEAAGAAAGFGDLLDSGRGRVSYGREGAQEAYQHIRIHTWHL